MSSNSHIIDVFFDRLDQRFEQVPHIIAETAIEHFKRNFETESFDGKPWQPLSPTYEAKKTRGRGRILTQSGILKGSIHASIIEAGKVIISAGGAKVPYARIHNEGGRVRGIQYVRPHDRKRVGGLRKYQVKWHARKVDFQMPRRQFMGFTQELKQSIVDRISKL